jgi:hypothetical protein
VDELHRAAKHYGVDEMMNRASKSWRLRLGSILLGLLAGAQLRAADPPKAECTSCHEQGAKLAKSAHAALTCDTCHEKHDQYPHPPNIEKPACLSCHADQAGDYAQSAHGQARKGGNEGAPDCALCHGSAHELLAPKSQAFRPIPAACVTPR